MRLVRLPLLLIGGAAAVNAQAPTDLVVEVDQPLINVSSQLFGVFFEEINHAGQNGLYAQLISNTNFGDLDNNVNPWTVGDATTTTINIDHAYPMNEFNIQQLQVNVAAGSSSASVINPGFHGINLQQGDVYDISFYYIGNITSFNVQLTSAPSAEMKDVRVVYGELKMDAETAVAKATAPTYAYTPNAPWQRVTATLQSSVTDPNGQFVIGFSFPLSSSASSFWFDVISVMPRTQLYAPGVPIRRDLALMVEQMAPAFMRFPGGCFVEGDRLADRFNWKNSIGPIEQRPGHWDLWNYYVDDGFGFYEMLQLIETMSNNIGRPVEPVWVVNNGVSHTQSVAPVDLQPYIDDALDSIEFANGDASSPTASKWALLRAQMGHPEPFTPTIKTVAIGNEDCGKPWYNENYQAFFNAFQARYPDITLIANCDMTSSQLPTQLWDYHVYQSSSWFFANDHYWDTQSRKTVPLVFNSEYAVTSDAGAGNLQAAVSEAAWAIGLIRNSDLVRLASYAPLFVNTNDRYWMPDAIVFDSSRVYGTPSYWNQWMFMYAARNGTDFAAGEQVLSSKSSASNANTAVVVTVANADATDVPVFAKAARVVVVRVVNKQQSTAQTINVTLDGLVSGANDVINTVEWTSLTGPTPTTENSFDNPTLMVPVTRLLSVTPTTPATGTAAFQFAIPAFSVNIFKVFLMQ